MVIFILLIFIIVPLVEIAVFLFLGDTIGGWNTFVLIVFTAILGAWLFKRHGLLTFRRLTESIQRQEFPIGEIFDGASFLVAGVFLLTPGFVTDILGFSLFVRPFRNVLRHFLWLILTRGQNNAWSTGKHSPKKKRGFSIDGKFREVDPNHFDRKKEKK